jgi:hypothetical protein
MGDDAARLHAQGKILPGGWLFPGLDVMEPLSARQLNRAVHDAATAAGSLAVARQLLGVHFNATTAIADEAAANDEPSSPPPTFVCRHWGRPMVIVMLLAPEPSIRAPPRAAAR